MSRPLVLLGLGLVVAMAVWLTVGNPHAGPPPRLESVPGAVEANGAVARVVDGDTVHITIDHTTEIVRLIGVDTPETVDERKPLQCYGPEASARTKVLLPPGTAVRLERDGEARDGRVPQCAGVPGVPRVVRTHRVARRALGRVGVR